MIRIAISQAAFDDQNHPAGSDAGRPESTLCGLQDRPRERAGTARKRTFAEDHVPERGVADAG